jgi:hypothetical protein
MTGPLILPAIRAGAAAESIRLVSRLCACPWAGPFPGARPVRWRRTGTDEGCPIHGSKGGK